MLSFPVNDQDIMMRVAGQRRADTEFVVSALASDGGGIPRNVTLREALRLAVAGVWTWQDAVDKLTRVPARLLGDAELGRFSPGTRADLVVVEEAFPHKVRHLVVGGGLSVADGQVSSRPTTFRSFAAASRPFRRPD
jgi:adenine deaminase